MKKKLTGIYHLETHLTNRQIEVLYHLAYGRSYKMIARSLGISPRTLEFYVDNARLKLNCGNRYDLAKKLCDSNF
jgi:DNA-binding CsgD family transcriptional regulator